MKPCHPCEKRRLGMVGLAKGALGLAKAALGIDAADEQTVRLRTQACLACPDYRPDMLGECPHCGCWLAMKRHVAAEHCPLGRWPGDQDSPPVEVRTEPP